MQGHRNLKDDNDGFFLFPSIITVILMVIVVIALWSCRPDWVIEAFQFVKELFWWMVEWWTETRPPILVIT